MSIERVKPQTICPDCDGQKLMHGYDCDCPTCEAAGVVVLRSHVGRSITNNCWWVRVYPFSSEDHAKAAEERIRATFSTPTITDAMVEKAAIAAWETDNCELIAPNHPDTFHQLPDGAKKHLLMVFRAAIEAARRAEGSR